MSSALARESLAAPPTGAPVFPLAPEHPLQFVAARRVARLHRRFHSLWGDLEWQDAGVALTAFWPDTGSFLRLWSAEGQPIRAEWLLVDPTGTAPPSHDSAKLSDASDALQVCLSDASTTDRRCSEQRFWELVEATDLRLELLRGRLYAMAGASPSHEAVVMSVGAALKAALGPSGCAVLGSNVYVRSSESDRHLPDVVVICHKADFASVDGRPDELTNPSILVEVVSPSSKRRDLHDKPEAYARIASLEAYLVIDPPDRTVMVWERREGEWSPRPVESGFFALHGAEVSVADFFDQLDLLS